MQEVRQKKQELVHLDATHRLYQKHTAQLVIKLVNTPGAAQQKDFLRTLAGFLNFNPKEARAVGIPPHKH